MIKVMRTERKDSKFMNNAEINPVHLFIISRDKCNEAQRGGDLLMIDDSDIKFAILGKEYVGSKIDVESVRTGLILLTRHIKKEFTFPPISIGINRHQFRNEHETDKFECIFTGVMSMMLSDEELEGLSLIITDYDSVDDNTTTLEIDKEND